MKGKSKRGRVDASSPSNPEENVVTALRPTVPNEPKPKTLGFFPLNLVPILGLALVVLFFSSFDGFDKEFAVSGSRVLLSNVFRVTFVVLLSAALLSAGAITIALLRISSWAETLHTAERLVLKFFLGAGAITMVMFPLGLLHLYYTAVAFGLVSGVLAVGFFDALYEVRCGLRSVKKSLFSNDPNEVPRVIRWLLAGLAISGVVLFLVTRCLYPGETSNDSYEIYWPYQIQTVASHALQPNEVWYMFCSFNGAGSNFLGILLTDLLAVQSVTYCFLLAAILAVFCLARRTGMTSSWATVAALVSFQCFAFTNPYWGAFQSHHIQAGAWLVAIVWAATALQSTRPELSLQCAKALACIVGSLAAFFPLFLIFVMPLLAGLCSFHVVKQRGKEAFGYVLASCAGGAVAVFIMLVNYGVGGMFLPNPLSTMWKYANPERFSKWCSPYNIHYLLEGSSDRTTGMALGGLLSKGTEFWVSLLRLKSYGLLSNPWILLPALALAVKFSARSRVDSSQRGAKILPSLLPLITCLLITNTSHPDSVFRNYGFVCFLIPVVLAWCFFLAAEEVARWAGASVCIGLSIAGFAFAPLLPLSVRYKDYRNRHQTDRLNDFLAFTFGRLSLQDALQRGDGLWPVTQHVKSVVGADKRIFSFCHPPQIASFLFPGSGVLTEPSRYGFLEKFDSVMFGSPDVAKAELQRQGIHYFLIDFTLPFFGALPYSPLFEPLYLSERFDIVTATGSAVLLTWKGQGQHLPAQVSNAWYQRVAVNRLLPDPHPDGVMGRLYENMKKIYDYNQGREGRVVRPPDLPKVTGWQ
jgi:hypothetical protein